MSNTTVFTHAVPPGTNQITVTGLWYDLKAVGNHVNDPTPDFLLGGDGGLSTYEFKIDGASLGAFSSTGSARVYVPVTSPLADGDHVVEWTELTPNAGANTGQVPFVLDTKIPKHPSITGIERIGLSNNWTVWGMTSPNARVVQVRDRRNGALLGGALADVTGFYASGCTIQAGEKVTDRVQAVCFDDWGNLSKPSPAWTLPKTGHSGTIPPGWS